MKSQFGYIAWVLTAFALIIGIMIFPLKFPDGFEDGGFSNFCIEPPPGMPLITAQSYFITSSYQVDGDGNRGGFNDSIQGGPPTQYKMIKGNVPIVNIGDNWFHFIHDKQTTADTRLGKRVFLWPTAISGAYTVELPDNKGEPNVSFDGLGVVFLQQLEKDGSYRTIESGNLRIPIVDVYKDINKPEIPYEDIFQCKEFVINDPKYSGGYDKIVIPSQETSSDKKELQLEWFLMEKSPFKAAILRSGCKPAVYLYPPKKQLINVKVYPKGFLTYVDPPYDSLKGWTVWAEPTGNLYQGTSIKSQGEGQYEYLYYESKIYDEYIEKPEKGWVVRGSGEMEELFNEILPKLGLNEVQKRDFIDYWEKTLPEVPYYFVGVVKQENVDQFERLEIIPKPDFVNRVRIYFERLDSFKEVEVPVLSSNEERLDPEKFNVVEWGGMVKNDSDHPFTCSQ